MTNIARPAASLIALLLVGSACHSADAQEFRVFTVVYDMSERTEAGRPPVVARAATLFHAGKVYDYLDSANEVIVYEPTERRFRVLSPSRGIVATVAFDEIRHLLKIAHEETQRESDRLAGDPNHAQAAALLQLQLDPRFQESFDEPTRLLTLDGGALRYEARLVDPGRPGTVEAYLDYADWVHRLNYLLHPGLVLPEPRLALNQALRARGRLPESVEQRVLVTPPQHLRAEHSLNFQLNAQDRALIHQWESRLKGDSTRQVSLRDYQKAVLTVSSSE